MNYFIKNIHVNNLFHLNDFDIPIADEKYPHLIITGKNGSGKTVILNAVSDFLNIIKNDKSANFLTYKNSLHFWDDRLKNETDEREKLKAQQQIDFYKKQIDKLYGRIDLQSDLMVSVIEKYNKGEFIIAFYQADRKSKMEEPKNPTKPVYNKKGDAKEFLNFLSDLKIQEALARNEKQTKDADEISAWFNDFESLMRKIYQDDHLKLEFNYRDYSFRICTEDKRFKFTEVSDGFAAVLDIVTHLHLALQKVIMPLLTKVFPNIQFIITTHSPFILSSMSNAVAYDLEHREVLDDLTEYSFESLAEGYFGVTSPSSYVELQFDSFKKLLLKEDLTAADKAELKRLKADFEKINEVVSPLIVGEFRQIAIQYSDKLKNL